MVGSGDDDWLSIKMSLPVLEEHLLAVVGRCF